MKKSDSGTFQHELGVGEVARRCGVAVSAIHFYEAKGLITSWRNAGNQRRYPREVLRRVSIIKVAQRLGIPLAAIKQAMDSLPKGRTPTDQDWRKLSSRWQADLDERIGRLGRLRDLLSGCIGWRVPFDAGMPATQPLGRTGWQRPGPAAYRARPGRLAGMKVDIFVT